MYEKLFEKHINGIVNEESFMQLSQKYETERDELKVKIRQYQEELSEIENLRTSKEQFTMAIRKTRKMYALVYCRIKRTWLIYRCQNRCVSC